MSFLRLPDELIHQCCFHVVAHDPLGLPHAIIPLALICRAFNVVVLSHAFKARVFRFMFDVGAVTRRIFHPRDTDLADELQRCCNLLKEIRKGDVTESFEKEETLISAYILMLSNDGKNYAQLEYAGLDAYVDKFITTTLWDGSETNQGWPLDSTGNASALWLMWMTLTKQKLAAQTLSAREKLTRAILPYVVLPHRYASSLVPPNHFNLPLDSKNPYHQKPLIITTAPETPYPIYLNKLYNIPYFNARIPISSPLTTIAAKLLFVAMKEMTPVRAPPHLPQAPGPGIVGLTQEDYREFNRSPGARLCSVVTWNWDTGSPNRVGGEDGDASETNEGWEESKVWDTEWWRRMLCLSFNGERPKYLPGNVFNPGSMRGPWHGKKYNPLGNLFVRFLRQPSIPYPGIPDPADDNNFTEASIGLSMTPVFLEIQEHHKICECAQGSLNVSEFHPYVAPTYIFTPGYAGVPSSSSTPPTSVPIGPQSGRCGIVPIPAPLVFQATQGSSQNQGEQEDNEGQDSEALDMSLPTPRVNMIDYSMSNAWYPGPLESVSFTKLPITGDGKRDKIIVALGFEAPDFRSVLNRPEESECLALGGRWRQQDGQGKMNAFVYETYDPEKSSMHRGLTDSMSDAGNAFMSASSSNEYPSDDPHKCQRCLQRESLIRLERKKAEHRSKMMLDRAMRSFGSGGYNLDQDDDDDIDEDEDDEMRDDDEDEEMRDVDVDELGIDVDGFIAQTSSCLTDAASSDATDDDSMSTSQIVSFGDDHWEQDVGMRNYYDKCRIGVECKGVADILLSGETGPRSSVWQQCKMYGRVRPWDGLIGILKTVANQDTISNLFMFGYIVGENNFVGEWRLATSDPLCPAWGSAFVMSRKIDGG